MGAGNSSGNQDQIDFWNTAGGLRWTEEQEWLDAWLAAFSEAALHAAAATVGEKVIDIGCGCGATTLALGGAVGAGGQVLGVDVSAQMLARAEQRAHAFGLANVRFQLDDASAAAVPAGRDLLFSRFGVMFFADPTAAFTHMRGALRSGGRLTFVCWRAFADNPWALIPTIAALKALDVALPKLDPHAPGPFAFADAARLKTVLANAGFADIAIAPCEAPLTMGASVEAAALVSMRVGPLARVMREHDGADLDRVLAAVAAALAPYASPEGVVLPGATWIVTARSP